MVGVLKRFLLLGYFATLALSGRVSFAQPMMVRLDIKPKTSLNGHRIYLSHIAKCTGIEQRCHEITGIDVGQTPAPGRSAYISRGMIESILEKEWPGVGVEFAGAESARVEAIAVDLVPDDVAKKLQVEISDRIGPISNDIKIRVVRLQTTGFAQARPSQIKVEFPDLALIPWDQLEWLSRNLSGSRLIQVRISNPDDADDRSLIQANVQFNVERRLPTLKQSAIAGSVIAKDQVVMGWSSMRRGVQDFATEMHFVSGKKARQSIAAGEPIPIRYLDSPIAVNRNQEVTMIIRRGDLEIASRATATDQASIGQTLDVVNIATKKRMRARVIDEKTVESVAF